MPRRKYTDEEWRAILEKEAKEAGGLDKINITEMSKKYDVTRRAIQKAKARLYGNGGTEDKKEDGKMVVEAKNNGNNGKKLSLDDIDPRTATLDIIRDVVRAEGYEEGTPEFDARVTEAMLELKRKRKQLEEEQNDLLREYENAEKKKEETLRKVKSFLEKVDLTLEERFDLVGIPREYIQKIEEIESGKLYTEGDIPPREVVMDWVDKMGGVVVFPLGEVDKKKIEQVLLAHRLHLFDPNDKDSLEEIAYALGKMGYKVVDFNDKEDIAAIKRFLLAQDYIIIDKGDDDWKRDLKRHLRASGDFIFIDTTEDDWTAELSKELRKYGMRLYTEEDYERDVREEADRIAEQGMSIEGAIDFLTKNGYEVEKAVLTKDEFKKKLEEYKKKWEEEFDLKLAKETEMDKMEKFSKMVEKIVDTAISSFLGAPTSKEEEKAIEDLKRTTTEDLLKAKEEWDKLKAKKRKKGGKKKEKKEDKK